MKLKRNLPNNRSLFGVIVMTLLMCFTIAMPNTLTAYARGVTAVNDYATTAANTPVNITVLANDTGNGLGVQTISQGSNGTVYCDNNVLKYTPNNGFIGTDTFTYTVHDLDGKISSATVTVNVGNGGGTSSSYITTVPDNVSTGVSTPININPLANDTSSYNYTLSLIALSTCSHGSASYINNTVIYTPSSDYSGTDNITYTVSDGHGNTAQGTITITIGTSSSSTAALRVTNDSTSTSASTPVTINVLSNDVSSYNYTLSLFSVSTPLHGTAYTVGSSVVYTPAASFSGTDTFTYTAGDNHGNTAQGTVTVTVTGSSSSINAVADTAVTAVSTPAIIPVLANDKSINNYTLSLTSVSACQHGSATITGTSITYVPVAGYTGTDTFTYYVNDGHNGTAQATVTVTVTTGTVQPATTTVDPSTIKPAVINDDTAKTTKGTAVRIDILSNDSSPNGKKLTIKNLTNPAHGKAVINPSGSDVTYTPNSGFAGTDIFYYIVDDGNGGSAKGSVTVTVADTPSASSVITPSAPTAPVTSASASLTGKGVIIAKNGLKMTQTAVLYNEKSTKNSFIITWAQGKVQNKFNLTSLTKINHESGDVFSICSGTGAGTLNGKSGYTVSFVFIDGSASKSDDMVQIIIKNSKNAIVIKASNSLTSGDYSITQ